MLKKIKFYSSLCLARAAYTGIKLCSKSSGTSFAGKLVLKFNPDFLKSCGQYIKNEIIKPGINKTIIAQELIIISKNLLKK